jgi:tRNA-specific adenosine deaminase 2
VVCRKRNRPNETYNPTAHAEMLAIDEIVRSSPSKEAAKALFSRCTLYVTVEPCVMCAAALARVGMGEVIFGALNDKFGGCGTAVDVITGKHCPNSTRHQAVPCTGGVMMDDAVQLLREFYARGNVRAPRPQRPVPPSWKVPASSEGEAKEDDEADVDEEESTRAAKRPHEDVEQATESPAKRVHKMTVVEQ